MALLKSAVLIGRTGSGKSTVANMFVKGDLEVPHEAEIGDGSIRGTTMSCSKLAGRGWTVVDTVGFGEGLTGKVPHGKANDMVINFLKEMQGEYSHIIFVMSLDRFDYCTEIIWKAFLEIFKGGEKNIVVLLTKAKKRQFDENLGKMKEAFKECEHFLYADFPQVEEDDPEIEELNREVRRNEWERVEGELLTMFTSSVKPDISGMTNDQIEEKAESILRMIARLIKEAVAKYGAKFLSAAVFFVNAATLLAEFV